MENMYRLIQKQGRFTKKVTELTKELKTTQKGVKDISSKNLQLQKELKEVQDEIRKEGGHFMEKFDDFMDTLKL